MYTVRITAQNVLRPLSEKPEAFGPAGSELRTSEGAVFHKNSVVYSNTNGQTLVRTAMVLTLDVKEVIFKDGAYRFVHTDGTKSSYFPDRGTDVEIEPTDGQQVEDEEETPKPKAKKAKAVESEEDEDFEVPTRGKKAKAVEPDEDEEEDEEDEEETPKPKAKAKKAKAVEPDEDEEDEEETPKAKAKKASAQDWDDFE